MRPIFVFLALTFLGSPLSSSAQNDTTYWWNDAVFYEIFVRSFYDSDADGIGDFQGIIDKLDYLNDGDPNTDTDLGVTGIWLMPINPSPSYHGYDVTDYYGIEPDYGTMEDFKAFLQAAHDRGIKVVMDWVLNHSSTQHPWFQQARNNHGFYSNFYRFSNTNPGYNGPWGQSVWHYNNDNNDYYYGVFWGGMPDLNFNFQAVTDSMNAATEFWLDEIGVDGFRCDAVKYLVENGQNLENTAATYQWWQDWHTFYKSVNPDAMTVGEAWDSRSVVLNYTGDKFDYCFEFDMAQSILNAANNGQVQNLRNSVQDAYDQYPYLQYGTFLTNHDQNRVMSEFGENILKAKVAAGIYLTLPGVPYLYYGEEVGMVGTKPDEHIRRPMQWSSGDIAGFSTAVPWQWPNTNYPNYNVEKMESDPNSLLNLYKTLIHIRNKEIALRRGTYLDVGSSDNRVYSFLRQHGEETVLVAINTSHTESAGLTLNLNGSGLTPNGYDLWDRTNDNQIVPITLDGSGDLTGLTLEPYEVKVMKWGWPTGLAGVQREGALWAWPNPVSDQLSVRLENPAGAATYQLQTLDGKLAQTGSLDFSGSTANISVAELAAGMYVLKVTAPGQAFAPRKIMVR